MAEAAPPSTAVCALLLRSLPASVRLPWSLPAAPPPTLLAGPLRKGTSSTDGVYSTWLLLE